MNRDDLLANGPLVVNTDDMTLAEIDRAAKLIDSGRAGRVQALTFVWLKRDHPGVQLGDVAQLRMRDVEIVEDAPVDDDGEPRTAADPTNAR